MQVGRFEFNERPRRPIFPRFSYPVELRVSAQLCFNCTAIINYSPPRRKYSYRRSRVNKGRITLPRRPWCNFRRFVSNVTKVAYRIFNTPLTLLFKGFINVVTKLRSEFKIIRFEIILRKFASLQIT